jgi:hypothetical protein
MHADEVDIDVELVRRLLAAQFPRWTIAPARQSPPCAARSMPAQ